MLGYNILNKKWDYDEQREEKTKDKDITYFNKLRDLTEDVIPKKLIELIEEIFSIGIIVVAKISKDNIALGDFTLIFGKNQKLKNKELLEIYLNQTGLFLERKKIEKNLIKVQKEYYELAQESPIGIISCDKEGTIKFINSMMMNLLNLSNLEKAREINLLEYNLFKKNGFSDRLKNVLDTGKSIVFEMRYENKGNKNKWLKVNIESNEETGKLVGARITADDITDKKIDEEKLKKQVEVDPLTGAYNRNLLKNSLLEEKLKISSENNLLSCIVVLDVDDFKDINDSYGHRIGDYVLKYLTERIKNELRKEDLIVRTGGDEFLIYLHDIENENNDDNSIKRIFNKISKPYRIEDHIKMEKFSLNVSFSIGACFYPMDGGNIEELMAMADIALYNVKETGKSRFFYYDPNKQNYKIERYRKRQEIYESIEKGQIISFYQPIFNIEGKIKRLEALARINKDGNIIHPSEFIPQIEKTFLIEKIGEIILDKVIEDIVFWRENGFDQTVSANIYSRQLNEDFYIKTMEKLIKNNLKDKIVFEITEELLCLPKKTQ